PRIPQRHRLVAAQPQVRRLPQLRPPDGPAALTAREPGAQRAATTAESGTVQGNPETSGKESPPMARQSPSIIRTAAQWGIAALVGGAAGALASRLMDELTVWRMKQKHGEGGELGLADLAEDVHFDHADLLAHFVVDN